MFARWLWLQTVAATPPNILWIMADDLGIGEVGFERRAAFARGERSGPAAPPPARPISTPHLDALAASGLTFDAAYAGYTICAPSRTTLFTGRHSGHFVRVPSAPTFPDRLRSAGYQTSAFGKSAPMDAPEGGSSWRPRSLEWGWPNLYGFDTFVGQANQTLGHNMYPTSVTALRPSSVTAQNSTLLLPLNSKPKSRSLCMAQPDQYNHTTDVFNQAALEWLRQGRDPARPFFLYMSFTVPHAGGWGSAPLSPEDGNPVPSDLQYASRTSWPEVERDHAASITHLDARIGEMMAALDSLQLANSTIVWFASDNGPHNEGGHSVDFFSSSGGLRGYKRSFYEGGVRSPSIVRWPGVTQPGGRSATPWAFWDVYPTMLEMAGLPPVALAGAGSTEGPAAATRAVRMASSAAASREGGEFATRLRGNGGGDWQDRQGEASLDGRSIVPALRGEQQPPPRYMFWTWREHRGRDVSSTLERLDAIDGGDVARRLSNASGEGGGARVVGYAARMGDWKLIVHRCADQASRVPSLADADAAELYHLPSDGKEERDVAAKQLSVLGAMLAVLADPQERLSCECFQC